MSATEAASLQQQPQQTQETQEQRQGQQLPGRVSCAVQDYLKQDPAIRGQNYALISFLSPEETLRSREVFEFSEFLRGVGEDVAGLFDGIEQRFGNDPNVKETLTLLRERHAYLLDGDELQQQLQLYRGKRADELQKKFQERHGFQTNVRGFKIRGVHDSIEEAHMHAREIHHTDPNFDVFVAQVGCWCPWSPNPAEIKNCEYAETELNSLMHAHEENAKTVRTRYEQRKDERQRAVRSGMHDRVQIEDVSMKASQENDDVQGEQKQQQQGQQEGTSGAGSSGSGQKGEGQQQQSGLLSQQLAQELDKNVHVAEK